MKKIAPSVQRKIMYLTPAPLLEMLCRVEPRFVIELLCHWANEKNANIEERFLSPRLGAVPPVAKKLSQLSVLSIINLIRQDESLWRLYGPSPTGGKINNVKVLPYILLEVIFELGGTEGRTKVLKVLEKLRSTIGGGKQIEMLRVFKTDNVLDIFEMLPGEVGGILRNGACEVELAAFWLNYWDLRMQKTGQPSKSEYWLGQMPGQRAFHIEQAMRSLEFKQKFAPVQEVFDYKNEWNEWKNI
jgi:hypothetical protein